MFQVQLVIRFCNFDYIDGRCIVNMVFVMFMVCFLDLRFIGVQEFVFFRLLQVIVFRGRQEIVVVEEGYLLFFGVLFQCFLVMFFFENRNAYLFLVGVLLCSSLDVLFWLYDCNQIMVGIIIVYIFLGYSSLGLLDFYLVVFWLVGVDIV